MEQLTGKIVLRSLTGKRQTTCFASPLPMKNNGELYRGIVPSFVKTEHKEQFPYIPDETTRIALDDGTTFDPENETDKVTISWLLSPQDKSKTHPYVVWNKEDARSKPSARFYVENKEAEADKTVSRKKRIIQAQNLIASELTEGQKINLAKATGLSSADKYSKNQLEEYLFNYAESSPDLIIRLSSKESSTDLTLSGFVSDLIKHKIIGRRGRGAYKFGNGEDAIVLGLDNEAIIKFLKDSKNKETLESLKLTLDQETK